MSLAEAANFLNRVAADRISHVLLGVLEPGVEGRGLLGEGQVELLDLAELVLDSEQPLLPLLAVAQELVPAGDDHSELLVNGIGLDMVTSNQLILEGRDVLDTLGFKSSQANVKSLLFCQKCLNAGQIASKHIRLDMRLLVRNPGLH